MTTHFTKTAIRLGLALALAAASVRADVTPAVLFGEHMVLQQGIAVPVWGTAAPGEEVTVRFRAQEKKTTAAADGKWLVKLDPLKPGEPSALSIAGRNTVTFSDVLVGEVWVGSGQSNIDTPVAMYAKEDAALREAAGANHPQLRLFHAGRWNGWREAKPDEPARFDEQNVGRFSAQLFYFGLLLQKELGVPVGVIESAKGGMPSSVFIANDAFHADPEVGKALAKWDEQHPYDVEQKKYEAALEKWKSNVSEAIAAAAPGSQPPSGDALVSGTAPISKEILGKFPKPKEPVRAADIRTGEVFDTLVRPVLPFAIRGVLWDQGESYSGVGHVGIGRGMLMPALIRAWRTAWGQGGFPWIFVQKQNGGGCALRPEDPVNKGAKPFEPLPQEPPARGYETVEGYLAGNPPNVFLSQTSDLVPGVHPINKSGYAARAACVALGGVYGRPIAYSGPVFESFKVEGEKVRIAYAHIGQGLTVPATQKLQGFAVAGADRKFRWADAVIEGQSVVVSSPEVPAPVAVRYWHAAWGNLFNKDGLPALGFKTDTW